MFLPDTAQAQANAMGWAGVGMAVCTAACLSWLSHTGFAVDTFLDTCCMYIVHNA